MLKFKSQGRGCLVAQHEGVGIKVIKPKGLLCWELYIGGKLFSRNISKEFILEEANRVVFGKTVKINSGG